MVPSPSGTKVSRCSSLDPESQGGGEMAFKCACPWDHNTFGPYPWVGSGGPTPRIWVQTGRHLSRESFACTDYSLSKKRHSRAACPTSQAFCPGGEACTRTLWLGPAASTSPGQDQTLKFPCFVNRGFEDVVRPVFNQNSYFISSP